MKKSIAVLIVVGGITIYGASAEIFGSAVSCDCTSHIGQVVCASLHVVSAGLPTTLGATIDWTPPF